MRTLLLALPLFLALPAHAEYPELRQVAPNAWVLLGTSGNVLIVPSPQGALIVDDERPADNAEIVAAVAKTGSAPVRYAIDTHWHMDHSGGNGALAKAGAVVIAHRNVRVRRSVDQFMPAYKRTIPAGAPEELPAITFDSAMDIAIGHDTAELRYAPSAHTDGDTIVRLRSANVIHMGDVYFHGIWPWIDRASGGSVQGVIAAVDAALAQADAKTVIVPAHGPIASRAELVKYREMLAGVTAAVADAIKAGRTLDEIVAAKPAASWRGGMEGDEDRFVEAVYDSLKG
jgi:cyclase